MKTARFIIRATAGGFVKFLEAFTELPEFTKACKLQTPLPYEGRNVYLLPLFGGPPPKKFGSLIHEHGDLKAHILAYWADKVSTTEDGSERTDYAEAVAIGFKWTQIGEKLRVSMEYYEPVAGDYFARLLKEISQIWPEAAGGKVRSRTKEEIARAVEKAIQLHDQDGVPWANIAEQFGIGVATLRHWRKS